MSEPNEDQAQLLADRIETRVGVLGNLRQTCRGEALVGIALSSRVEIWFKINCDLKA
jgi:hypothetical protein